MEMGCNTREKQLSLYLDERLQGEDKEQFEAHLSSCEACQEAVAETASLRESVSLRVAPKAPDALFANVMAAIQEEANSAPVAQEEPAGWQEWLLGMLPTFRIAAPVFSGVAACLLVWTLAQPAQRVEPQTTASVPSVTEQMLFGEETNSPSQLVQGLWDDDEPAGKGG
jgi:anti-sigma factor RsiW